MSDLLITALLAYLPVQSCSDYGRHKPAGGDIRAIGSGASARPMFCEPAARVCASHAARRWQGRRRRDCGPDVDGNPMTAVAGSWPVGHCFPVCCVSRAAGVATCVATLRRSTSVSALSLRQSGRGHLPLFVARRAGGHDGVQHRCSLAGITGTGDHCSDCHERAELGPPSSEYRQAADRQGKPHRAETAIEISLLIIQKR